MKDEFEPFEEDFEAEPAKYQVWVLGYNKAEAITDFEILLEEFADPDVAIKFAKAYAGEGKYNSINIPEDVAYLEVLVETVGFRWLWRKCGNFILCHNKIWIKIKKTFYK